MKPVYEDSRVEYLHDRAIGFLCSMREGTHRYAAWRNIWYITKPHMRLSEVKDVIIDWTKQRNGIVNRIRKIEYKHALEIIERECYSK